MKILYVAPMDSIHAQRWISYFIGRGHQVTVINSAPSSAASLPDAQVFNLEHAAPASLLGKIAYLPKTLFKLKRWTARIIAQYQPDVIHIHWLASPMTYAVSLLGYRPIICTPWGSDLLVMAQRNPVHRFFVKRLIRATDRFCCDAPHLADQLVKFGAGRDRIQLIYFGTNTRTFSPRARDRRFAEELGFEADTPIILSSRALEPIYDVETLIRAVPQVLQHAPRARFIVVGDGSQRAMLEALTHELGIFEQVRFVGWLKEPQIAHYSASATLYVSTSLSDGGLAASTAEAMACGVAVVISDFGENRKWVADGKDGRLFPLRDHGALAAEIVALLKDPERLGDLGARGRDVILDKNDYFKEMGKVEAIYRQMADPG